MRPYFGKKIGQSSTELAPAVFFSFFLHVFLIVAAIMLYTAVTPKAYVPPFYQVKLVGQPADLSQPSPGETVPAAPKKETTPEKAKSSPKAKKAAEKPIKAAPKKSEMPELSRQKQKPTAPEQARSEAAPAESSPAGPAGPETGAARSGGKADGVAVGTTSPEFKFPPYLAIIREKIEQNWNPPPSAKSIKVKVLFTILRSGRVGDTKLDESSGNFYFDQAAVRAILLSSPFPALPEGFYKEYEVFSVDLMEKE